MLKKPHEMTCARHRNDSFSASYFLLLLNSDDFDDDGGHCALIIMHLRPLLACIGAWQPTRLLSSTAAALFRLEHTLIPTSVTFCIPMKALCSRSYTRLHLHDSPGIDASASSSAHLRAGRDSHCPLLHAGVCSTAALIARPSSRQYLGALPAAQYRDPSRAAMHNNSFY